MKRFQGLGVLDPDLLEMIEQEIATRRRRLLGREKLPAAEYQPLLPFPRSGSVQPAISVPEILTVLPVEPSPRAKLPAIEPVVLEVANPPGNGTTPDLFPAPTSALVSPPPAPVTDPTPIARPPRRSLREVLASFMEQRNIFWGELLGGMLIVGCSIALVISLWTTGKLEKIPFAPFVIFALITTALFGAGWYTLRHWKLESTSRGLLVIATLLVPLNFLVMSGLHGRETSGWEIPLEVGAVAVFAWMTTLAGRWLFSGPSWVLPVAIVGSSASQLIFSWIIGPEREPHWLLALGLIPVAFHGLSSASVLTRNQRDETDRRSQSRRLFGFVGLSLFAVIIALGFLIYLAGERIFDGDISPALSHVSLLVALAAWPVLNYGLRVHRTLVDDPAAGVWRTLGTAVALIGMMIMLAAGLLAWPAPTAVLLVCLFNFAIISYVAIRYELPIAHAAALPCLAVLFLATFHLTDANLSLEFFRSSESGTMLAGLFVLLAIGGEILARWGRSEHSACYAYGSALIAIWSLVLVTLPMRGIENPGTAFWIYALYGAGSLMMNARWRRPLVTSSGLALIVGATLWILWWRFQQFDRFEHNPAMISVPRWGTVLAIEALVMAGFSALIHYRRARRELSVHGANVADARPSAFQEPLARSAEATSILAILAALAGGLWSPLKSEGIMFWVPAHILTAFTLMALYLLLGGLERRKGMARLAGVMFIGGVVAATGFIVTIRENLAIGPQLPMLALAIAGAGTFLSAVAIRVRLVLGTDAEVTQPSVPWYGVLVAWRGPAAFAAILAAGIASISLHPSDSIAPAYTAAFLAATAFLLAWGFQTPALTWIGSAASLGAIAYAFAHQQAHSSLPFSWQWPLLVHGTVFLTVSLVLKYRGRKAEMASTPSRRLFAEPLAQSALAFSLPTLFVLLFGSTTAMAGSAGLFWLAGMWLVMAVEKRHRVLFTAFQLVLAVAVLFGSAAWLETHGCPPNNLLENVSDPRIWQAFGIGLALLSLSWMTARIGLQSKERARALLDPGWPTVDRLVLGALVIGQMALAATWIVPGIAQEVWGAESFSTLPSQSLMVRAFGPGAWLLLGLTGLTLLAGLWERRVTLAVIGLIGIASAVPILAAGRWGVPDASGASALRWAAALAYLTISICLWSRATFSRLAKRTGWKISDLENLTSTVRLMILVLMAAPALMLTLLSSVLGLLGFAPGGPGEHSIFYQMGWVANAVIPATLVSLILVGHALRERSPIYAFGAGLVANLTLMGGYALSVVLGGGVLDTAELVRIVQMGTVLASVWDGAWLLIRAWIFGQRAEPESPRAQPLLTAQLALGAIGNILVLGLGFWLCILAQEADTFDSALASVIGSPLGWLALATAGSAWAIRHYLHHSTRLRNFGVLGLAAVVLVACQVEAASPGWGHRALMLGWAIYPLVWVIAIFAWSRKLAIQSTSLMLNAAEYWVRLSGLLSAVLAINAAIVRGDHLWSALAIGLICPSAALMAVWRRQETWAFAAGVGANLAASLVCWHGYQNLPISDWWIILLQVNVVAASAVSLLWLFWRYVRGWKIADGGLSDSRASIFNSRSSIYLTSQVAMGLLGLAVLLVVPVLALVLSPANPPLPAEFGGVGSWLALAMAIGAAGWYFYQIDPSRLVHLCGCFGLGLGILAACFVCHEWDYNGTWLSYHVLTAAWWVWALVMLIASMLERPSSIFNLRSSALLGWLHVISLLVLALSLGSALGDPGRLYWSSGPVLAVSLLLGTIAIWQRRPLHVYACGLLINVAGSLIWLAGDVHSWENLAYMNVLCFAVAGGLWTGLELWLQKRMQTSEVLRSSEVWPLRGDFEPFPHLAIILALILCGAMSVLDFGSACLELPTLTSGMLAWAAIAAITAATILLLWDASADFARLGLYAIGSSALMLALQESGHAPADLLWSFAISASSFILVVALLAQWIPTWENGRSWLRLPKLPTTWPESWFVPSQLAVGGVVVVLSLWMSVSFETTGARMAGPLAVAILGGAGILMAEQQKQNPISNSLFRSPMLEFVTLAVGTVVAIELGWAFLSPADHELSWLWLHRNVVLMVALSAMTVVYGIGLRRLMPLTPSLSGEKIGLTRATWTECGRRIGPWLGLLACVALGVVLVQETIFYDGFVAVTRLIGTMLKLPGAADLKPALPNELMAPEAIVTVACAIVALIVAGLYFAVLPDRDPLGLSEGGRKAYVYSAEVLLVVLFVHFKITMPELFRGRLIHYWPFVVMGIAFMGVGLSEFFRRKNLRVLAEPLEWTGGFLPLLPVLVYWVLPHASEYALVWFFAGLLYGVLSIFKRSWRFALLGAVAANMGLWVLLQSSEIYFWKHPQMWVIPLALVVLVAEQLNQDRLKPSKSAAIRYFALIVIYVSSTADMFIAGLGKSWELPLALMVLSVIGVLAGMLLRVRAFLYLGSSFLVLVISTMIWHAGVDQHQPWVLWSAGILLGVAIYALFMYFEKRRQKVLHLVDQLKKWDS
jgi:hypothetical protein